jgi:tRNA(Ile)-lysidine synthase
LKTLVSKIQRQRLFEPGETVVVAVSGGADSVALLDILSRLEGGQLRLVVAHVNHGLRGEASDGDEEFVSQLAARYGFPFESQRSDVAGLSLSLRISLEDAGRRERYSFFARVAKTYGAASIALAHHRDDQAETVLIRLLRGAGGAGLSAMVSLSQGMLKRPLLTVCRAEIEQYLQGEGISHRTDASNADTAILRNSIRHELMPLLTRYNPKIAERLAATAEILAGDEELLQGLTESAYQRLVRPGNPAPELEVDALAREPRALRLRIYRRALSQLRGDLQHIGLAHLDSIDRLVLSGRPNSSIKLPGACFVSRSYHALSFTKILTFATADFATSVAGLGSHTLAGDQRLLVESVPRPDSLDAGTRRVVYFDPAAAPFPWILRSFAPGDRIRPLGMTGAQKVKDLFMNEKMPANERRRIPLLESAGRVLWVCGVKVAQEARVCFASGPVLRVEILEITP